MISSIFPNFYKGIHSYKSLLDFSVLNFLNPSVSSIGPGAIPITLMFLGPNSTAKCLVIASTAALAAPAWV